MKKRVSVPRWLYLLISVLTTGESIDSWRQTWLKYRWGDALRIPTSSLILSGVLALLFTVLAVACWYLWITYHKRNDC